MNEQIKCGKAPIVLTVSELTMEEIMNDRRYQILWLDRNDLINLINGAVRITNLPHDCRVEAMCDIERDAIGLCLYSKEFEIVPAAPGAEIRTFNAEFQSAQKSMIAADHRYLNDIRFHTFVHAIINSMSQEGVTLADIRQALMIVERIPIISLPRGAAQIRERDYLNDREMERGRIVMFPPGVSYELASKLMETTELDYIRPVQAAVDVPVADEATIIDRHME